MKDVTVTVGLVRVSIVPFGWVSCADTINGERSDSIIAEFNSTVQVTVTEDVTLIGLDGILVTDTESGGGTEGGREDHHFMALLSLESHQLVSLIS